jgi:hypothetical protein
MMYIKPNESLSADICHHVSINNHKRMLIIGDLDGSLKELQNALMVLGNHESFMIEAILSNDLVAKELWRKNGGGWHTDIPHQKLVPLAPTASFVDYFAIPIAQNWSVTHVTATMELE